MVDGRGGMASVLPLEQLQAIGYRVAAYHLGYAHAWVACDARRATIAFVELTGQDAGAGVVCGAQVVSGI